MAKDRENAKAIGNRIQQARREAGGMTQRELGDLLGVTERSVAAYERGEVVPYRFVRQLGEILGVEAAWILHGTEAVQTQESARWAEVIEELKALRAEVEGLRAERGGDV